MRIAVLIPCYNGGELIKKKISTLFSYINSDDENKYDVYIVNDGSTDNTLNIINKIKNAIVFTYKNNLGKGGAIKYGINHINKCDYVLFMDCDFSTNINCLKYFIKEMKKADILIGSRFCKGSKLPIKRTFKRRLISKSCNKFVNFLFHLNFKDTQCGFKMFKYDIAKFIVNKQKINDWSFDVEYLYIAKLNNFKVKEIPVEWTENFKSSLSLVNASNKFVISLFKIKHNKKEYLK